MKTSDSQRIKLLISWLVAQGYAVNQEDLGCKLGITSKSYLSQLVNGKVNNDEFINKLSKLDKRINNDWLMTGEGDMLNNPDSTSTTDMSVQGEKIATLKKLMEDVQKGNKRRDKIYFVPLMNIDAVGGSNNEVCDTVEYIEEVIPVRGARETSICIPVSGDSMMPIFNPGDLVVIDEIAEWNMFLEMGQYYVIVLKDFRRLIKKVTYSEEDKQQNFLLVSENPNYPPTELPKTLVQRIFIVTQKYQKLTL